MLLVVLTMESRDRAKILSLGARERETNANTKIKSLSSHICINNLRQCC